GATSLAKGGIGTSTWLRSIPIIQNAIRSASIWPICSNCSTTAINGGGPEYYGGRRRRSSNCRCPHGRVSHSSSQLRNSRTTKILSDARRRGGVAARGARAAAGQAADHRVLGLGNARNPERLGRRFCATTT